MRAPGIGPARFAFLLEYFGSVAGIFSSTRSDLESVGLPAATIDYLAAPDWSVVEQDLAWLDRPRNHLVSLHDSDYPPLLRQIKYPPPVLFVHGDPSCLGSCQVAIVGTRSVTPSGRETAHSFATYLAASGIIITSGLALGVDKAAHKGALAATEGRTIAVMGTGLDQVYPAKHRDLAHAIAERGALVSELPPGTSAMAANFPRRNRIISGLTLGVLVVEAALRSGSLITAQYALEQGREVFAIPGSIHNPVAKGCHALIRNGAKLVETAADIVEELGPLANAAVMLSVEEFGQREAAPELDAEYQRLLEAFGHEPVSVDVLVQRCGLTAEAVSSMLLILELQGYINAQPGGLYSRLKIERS